MQRATYIAQLAAPFTLLATVGFSYLGWREAANANEQQQRFFISQFPPEIDLVGAESVQIRSADWIFLTFKNVGESAAKSPCVTVHGDLSINGTKAEPTSCTGDNSYRDAIVDRGASLIFYVPQSLVGFQPDQFVIWRPGDERPSCESGRLALLMIDIRYSDVSGSERNDFEQLLICGTVSDKTSPESRSRKAPTESQSLTS